MRVFLRLHFLNTPIGLRIAFVYYIDYRYKKKSIKYGFYKQKFKYF